MSCILLGGKVNSFTHIFFLIKCFFFLFYVDLAFNPNSERDIWECVRGWWNHNQKKNKKQAKHQQQEDPLYSSILSTHSHQPWYSRWIVKLLFLPGFSLIYILLFVNLVFWFIYRNWVSSHSFTLYSWVLNSFYECINKTICLKLMQDVSSQLVGDLA